MTKPARAGQRGRTLATSGARIETEQGTAPGDTPSDQAPQSPFDERDHRLAFLWRPRLYCQITQEHVSFDHIAKAWRIGNNPAKPAGKEEQRVSQFLEYLARRKFSEDHEGIEKDYWCKKPWAGCALTGDGYVHSVMNFTDPELVLYENHVHQLCRDAHRTFGVAAHRSEKAKEDLTEVGEKLYSVLTRVILAASVLENEDATPRERDDALAAVRIQWKTVRDSVEEMIQRQARFEYFVGVGLSALVTIPAMAVAGWAAVHYGANQLSEPGEPGSFTAAIIGGAAGAVISVTQRMTANTLVVDFRAPKLQKIALGALRPIVGAVFGAAIYFAIVGGLLAVEARTGKDASVAVAFYAMAGFAAGFSERFATDVLDRASSGILPSTRGRQDAEKPEELSQLLSEQSRHAETPAVTHEREAPARKGQQVRKVKLARNQGSTRRNLLHPGKTVH
jgi:hypothetical protein